MNARLLRLLTQLSERGPDALLAGGVAAEFRGPEFNHLLNQQVLEEQAPISEWDVCGDCECGLSDRPIRIVDGVFRAQCPLDPGRDVVLSEEDRRTFLINGSGLVDLISRAFGLSTPELRLPGIWSLGTLPTQRPVLLALACAALEPPGVRAALKSVTRGAAATLVAPRLPTVQRELFEEADIHHVELGDVLGADFEDNLVVDHSALVPTSTRPRLVLDRRADRFMLDGQILELPSQPFELFKLLSERVIAGRPVVSHQDIAAATGRESRDIVRNLRDRLIRHGLSHDEAHALIRNVPPTGYELALAQAEIAVVSAPGFPT